MPQVRDIYQVISFDILSINYNIVSFSQKKELHLLNGAKFSSEYGLAQIEGLEIYTSR